jgi:hypothetical protein
VRDRSIFGIVTERIRVRGVWWAPVVFVGARWVLRAWVLVFRCFRECGMVVWVSVGAEGKVVRKRVVKSCSLFGVMTQKKSRLESETAAIP